VSAISKCCGKKALLKYWPTVSCNIFLCIGCWELERAATAVIERRNLCMKKAGKQIIAPVCTALL
jgi:hypothetical protein